MNRYKKERLKHFTQAEIDAMDERDSKQQAEDAKNYPELYSFILDSTWDLNDRRKGISPLSKEARAYIRERFERGDYPERLHLFVHLELKLKHPEE